MKCKRCGRENPANVTRCMYCNTPFYGQYSNHNMHQKRKVYNQNGANNKTDNTILGIIIALVIIFVTLVGVSAFKNLAPHRKGFRSSGGGGAILNVNRPSQPSNEAPVSIDGEDPDAEIYSFNTDTYEILVGTTKTVKFTAEIFVNVELEENAVSVVGESGSVLGYMKDTGADGDAVADDGIYTLVTELTSDTRKANSYQAKVKNAVSNAIEIYFYTEITAEDYNICQNVINRVAELNEIESIKQYLAGETNVESHSVLADRDIVQYKMKSGITCVWEKRTISNDDTQIKGVGNSNFDVEPFLDYTPIRNQVSQVNVSRVHADGDVCVIRPFRGTQFRYDDFLDAGNVLANVLDGNVGKFDDGNANTEIFKSFGKYGVVLVDSHGTLSGENPYMLTGSMMKLSQAYSSADWQAERIIVCSSNEDVAGNVAVGAKFFDRYYVDNSLNGSVFYLGTCYSMYNDSIADALIKKGAEVVYGYSRPVTVSYCNQILQELFMNQLVIGMTTARDGFNNSRQTCGNTDPYSDNCELRMKGDDSFVLVQENRQGTIAGSVKDAATSQFISGALVRIYSNGKLIKSLRTNSSGYYSIELPVGEYIIKINHSHYKSAKIVAVVSENITTYIETLLMLDAGLNSGYANGTVTDATTGEKVAGVNIKLRKSWNNKIGTVIKTTITNENGYYEFSHNPGIYTIEYSKEGYITGYKNIIIGIVDFEAQNAVISPEMPDDGNFRIVLSWSNMPRDLDSHLTGPTVEGDRFHLFYKYANTSYRNQHSDYYQLDLDNTDIVSKPNIPETTTIVTQLDGVYRYSVHDYTNRGDANSDAMAQSNATVNVYKGSVLVATYHVPPNVRGTIWTVFELSGDEIKPINKIGNGYENDSQF